MQSIKRTEHDIYPFVSAAGRLAGAAKGKKVLITGGGKGVGRVRHMITSFTGKLLLLLLLLH
jgi:hypothetical protein